jgi:hypothetical protein
MAKINVKESNPERYARATAEQEALKKAYSSTIKLARICPFCDHRIENLCRGTHGGSYTKCSNCGESVFFPPVSFRRA